MPQTRTATPLESKIIKKVWQNLSPDISIHSYSQKLIAYQKVFASRLKQSIHDSRLVDKNKAQHLVDNSADYENVSYSYQGLEHVQSLIEKNIPVALVSWHHGALSHAAYSSIRKIPSLAVFTKRTIQYGKLFSFPMDAGKGLTLVKMDRFLRQARPVWCFLDAAPLGQTTTIPVFGCSIRISTAPMQIIRSVENVQIIPVSTFYEDESIRVIFHQNPISEEDLHNGDVKNILKAVFQKLEQSLRQNAPEQVRWRFFLRREKKARKQQQRLPKNS